jgi:hypothetical protein
MSSAPAKSSTTSRRPCIGSYPAYRTASGRGHRFVGAKLPPELGQLAPEWVTNSIGLRSKINGAEVAYASLPVISSAKHGHTHR